MKGTRITKLISILLSVMMVVTLLPGSALAEAAGNSPDNQENAAGANEDPIQYTVTFVSDGATVGTQTVNEGETASKPDDPDAPEGMEFQYWYSQNKNKAYDFGTAVTEDFTLTALFEEAEEEPLPEMKSGPVGETLDGGIVPDETPLMTYTFYVEGSQWGEQQIVATGDTLNEPAVPTSEEGTRFIGWFDSSDTQFTSFGVQTVDATGSVDLTARFETAYYVFFYNEDGSAIIETRTPDENNQVSTEGVDSLELAADEALTGWSFTIGGTDVGSTVTVDGANINLYPIVENVIWVSFDSNGGSYVTPVYINPGTVLNQSDFSQVPVRAGYTFNGWTPEGINWGSVPTSNVTLNATWTANTN
ncbi:MAG TPA: InlB B-repeat-containing protein, partial [Eubacteriales bacterium]|nr:InlB B-repeat-containing protein [Eubacteriales bacterium]